MRKVSLDLTINLNQDKILCSFESSSIRESIATARKHIENFYNEGCIQIDPLDNDEQLGQSFNHKPNEQKRVNYIIENNDYEQQAKIISAEVRSLIISGHENALGQDQDAQETISAVSNNLAEILVQQSLEIQIAELYVDSFYKALQSQIRGMQEQLEKEQSSIDL